VRAVGKKAARHREINFASKKKKPEVRSRDALKVDELRTEEKVVRQKKLIRRGQKLCNGLGHDKERETYMLGTTTARKKERRRDFLLKYRTGHSGKQAGTAKRGRTEGTQRKGSPRRLEKEGATAAC